MSIEKSLNKFDDYYHHLLLGIASVLLITPISSLAKPISSPATPETVPSKTADKAKQNITECSNRTKIRFRKSSARKNCLSDKLRKLPWSEWRI